MVPVVINAFRPDVMKPVDYIEQIMALAQKYRSGGMKVLENAEAKIENRFLKNGIAMIVDGYNGREIYAVLDHEINSLMERHNAGQKILRFAGVQAPVFGMAGTLIGLIQMLMHIDNPSTIGPALATALITTFYGLILANLIVTPITAKLAMRTESEVKLIKTIRFGVMGIFEKSNPAKIHGINKGSLEKGNEADLCIFDINKPWIVNKDILKSKSKNTPIEDRKLQGQVLKTFVKGEMAFEKV